ncbi:phosphoribosylaminoimidazolesuccinocarboxamide synthase [Candidatus Anaplasma sp. TIGMIC]|uniref:phosphoribosylaminoimidazolesuccinocarboxamide synthase n=1 Tax=Candidatus Anaplasma sp. TIGMIC TaxID=3020713 RepID=UPI00232F5B41|nr:phosphoribosylaminoimidazolesuccinocarboxamide synthase [Candidatus Anaplasma sp. TIGMIC]MDB1135118.1 phosphoribosylaminoimidazolesuccinocarboxamide synthase [Candidatus Anaplasma sp. TIGMIC]
MNKSREILYEGKAKIIIQLDDATAVVQHFKDDVTAFNSLKRDSIVNKGIINNRISYLLMQHLEKCGIATHMLEFLNDREQRVKRLDMIPIEVVVRNIAAGSICKKFGIPKGKVFSAPLVELYYKSDELADPMISEDHALHFELVTHSELQHIRALVLEINNVLRTVFDAVDVLLVDFKLEFGRNPYDHNNIVLADEISPDTCRLWDKSTHIALDKDLYRLGIGGVQEGYSTVLQRIEKFFGQA